MLEEYFHLLGIRTAGPSATRLGYSRELAALLARHRRCCAAWQPHLQATRQALLTAAARRPNSGGTALVVGGGIASDLPIAELLFYFDRIVLVDIAFAYSTRRLAARWPGQVLCLLHDVTGVVDWLAEHRSLPPATIVGNPELPTLSSRPAWVASVNCLTQLPLLPVDWLHDHGIGLGQLEEFGRSLINAHLGWIAAWQTPICLVSEVEDQSFDPLGNLREKLDYRPLLGEFIKTADCLATWTWDLRPTGELANGATESRVVAAYSRD